MKKVRSEEFEKFDSATDKTLSVTKEELDRRLAVAKKTKTGKRYPKKEEHTSMEAIKTAREIAQIAQGVDRLKELRLRAKSGSGQFPYRFGFVIGIVKTDEHEISLNGGGSKASFVSARSGTGHRQCVL
jgi:hypothetical protein